VPRGTTIGVVIRYPIPAGPSIWDRLLAIAIGVIGLTLAYVALRVFRLERDLRARR
jgi:hypothetical protein